MSQTEQMETDTNPDTPAVATSPGEDQSGMDAGITPPAGKANARARLLTEAFDKVMEYGLQDPSRKEFGEFFTSMDTEVVDALYGAYNQALALIRSNCQEEYQLICTEHQVLDRLHALDTLNQVQEPAAEPAASVDRAWTTPGRKTSAVGSACQGPSEAVVRNAERVARQYALRQEAAHLQDMLEKSRLTESRLLMTLAVRQEAVEKVATTYQRAVADVKQVYDITRVWPTASKLKGPSD